LATALAGIKVLDLTRGKSGALASMLLSDNGARTIRLELPDRIERDDPIFMVWDRGKESVFLDIERQKDIFLKMVSTADVLIEDFSPSDRRGKELIYDELMNINPKLICCSITAYGKEGPLKDDSPDENLIMARMGILAQQPGFRPGPVHVAHPVPITGAAILACQGIVASLYAREKSGRGRQVETSVMAGALLYAPKVVADSLIPRAYQMSTRGAAAFYSVYECADGNWVQIGCIHSGFVDIAAAVLGIAEIVTDPRFEGGRPTEDKARQELEEIVAKAFLAKSSDEWVEIFDDSDVPFARAALTHEAFDNPQVLANGLVLDGIDPVVGPVRQMGTLIKFTNTSGRVAFDRHLLGQDTESVLKEYDVVDVPVPSDTNKVQSQHKPPLSGVRVLEMTNVIAGPVAGRCLGDLGADMVKMEPPYGDISRATNSPYFLHLNSNKRSISVNTKTDAGREIAQRLAAVSDVMLANMRPGATDRMGLSRADLDSYNPTIIEAHTTAFGWSGPFSHRPGVDPLAQGWMGLQMAQAGHGNPPVFLASLAPTDYTSGGLVALGAIMALYHREKTGVSQKVDCNLLNAGALLRTDAFMQYEGVKPQRSADKDQNGLSALHRLYETKRGWIYLIAEGDVKWKNFCAALGEKEITGNSQFETQSSREDNDQILSKALENIFNRNEAEYWIYKLKKCGVEIALVSENYNTEYFNDSHVLCNSLVEEYTHSFYGAIKYSSPGIKFGNTEPVDGKATPNLGENNYEILSDIGYALDDIDHLHQDNVLTAGEF